MKLIKASTEIITPINGEEILKQIELASRTCYQSEGKIEYEDYIDNEIEPPIGVLNYYAKSARVLIPKLISRGHEAMLEFGGNISVKFICDRGVSHELVRHRIASFAQESTRYVSSCEKRNILEFNCDNEIDIINAYNQGFSMREISEYSCNTEWEIRKILLKNNVSIRGLNNKGNRCENYFSNIDSHEKAYLLGLIQTDGSVRRTSKGSSSLCITQHKDYAWYIKLMFSIFSEYVGESNDRNCKQIVIGSKKIVNDLNNLGIVQNKTEKQSDKDIDIMWNSIPKEYLNSFIRGLIDGDGYVCFFKQKKSINESCNIGFCSVNEHLIDILIDFIKNNFDYSCTKYKDKNVYKFSITNYKKSIYIGEWLFKDFKYPFGHPKKSSAWIKRINKQYPIAEFGGNKFIIIKPLWLDSSSPESIFKYIHTMNNIEVTYEKLILGGWSPQQARSVLPNSLKTEINVSCNIREWRHIFKLRCANAAHPDMQYLMRPLLKEFQSRIPILFNDLKY